MAGESLPVERWYWPIASFGLATVIGAQAVGISAFVSPEVRAFTNANSGVLNLIFFAGVAAAVASIFVAVYVASHDENVSARSRTRWMLLILLTNVFGGPFFLVFRHLRHRRLKNSGW